MQLFHLELRATPLGRCTHRSHHLLLASSSSRDASCPQVLRYPRKACRLTIRLDACNASTVYLPCFLSRSRKPHREHLDRPQARKEFRKLAAKLCNQARSQIHLGPTLNAAIVRARPPPTRPRIGIGRISKKISYSKRGPTMICL